jgi:hypothetical protein
VLALGVEAGHGAVQGGQVALAALLTHAAQGCFSPL